MAFGKKNSAKIYKVASEADRKKIIDWSKLELIEKLVKEIRRRSGDKKDK